MSPEEQQFIKNNIFKLVKNTKYSPTLLEYLLSENLLTSDDADEIRKTVSVAKYLPSARIKPVD